ncbi:MAG: class D beta-lactamase [Flavobacteriales bacterium]|nr:class D beta-lactamase [Flavobacteriales bacterium]
MKIQITTLLFIVLLSACAEEDQELVIDQVIVPVAKQIVNEEMQGIIDSANLNGAILIYDLQEDTYYANNYDWCNEGKLPASTFKIINTIIGLECNVIESDSTIFKWDGKKQWSKNWEQDLVLNDAFHYSCVPCYQGVARQVGVKQMNKYITKLAYGTMLIDSSNLDLFWLEGESKINQFEQIDFLKRFYQTELPITNRTHQIMKKLMVIETTDAYTISGKTGWAMRNGNDNGWFVGYIETKDKVYLFATNVEPKKDFDINTFAKVRKEVTYKAFQLLNIATPNS